MDIYRSRMKEYRMMYLGSRHQMPEGGGEPPALPRKFRSRCTCRFCETGLMLYGTAHAIHWWMKQLGSALAGWYAGRLGIPPSRSCIGPYLSPISNIFDASSPQACLRLLEPTLSVLKLHDQRIFPQTLIWWQTRLGLKFWHEALKRGP